MGKGLFELLLSEPNEGGYTRHYLYKESNKLGGSF